MRAAIIAEAPRATWTIRRLAAALSKRGFKPVWIQPSRVSTSTSCPVSRSSRCLEVAGAILRSLGRCYTVEALLRRLDVARALEYAGVPVVNPSNGFLLARDKLGSVLALRRRGVPVPETLVTEEPAEAARAVEEWGEAVIKPLVGSLGFGSIRVSDADLAFRVASTIAALKQPIYVQRFVRKKLNRDVRVLVVDGTVVAAAYRYAPPGDWRTNVARGARVEAAKLDAEAEEIAVRAVEALGLVYGGVDMAEEEGGGYVVFEVNASPLWRGLYEATGVDAAEYIVEALARRARR